MSLTEPNPRSNNPKRTRNKSIVPVLENSIISSQDFKIIKR
jgi:hypothetical protein